MSPDQWQRPSFFEWLRFAGSIVTINQLSCIQISVIIARRRRPLCWCNSARNDRSHCHSHCLRLQLSMAIPVCLLPTKFTLTALLITMLRKEPNSLVPWSSSTSCTLLLTASFTALFGGNMMDLLTVSSFFLFFFFFFLSFSLGLLTILVNKSELRHATEDC